MGVVWRAQDELLGRHVAVKELRWPAGLIAAQRQSACRAAIGEARLAAQVRHRNVVQVFDIAEEDGRPWLVMELISGRSLRDLIEVRGPLRPAEAAHIGLGVAAALRAVHAAGIAHRDVKPANILLAPDRVVLTDFGIARAAGAAEPMTAAEALVGSPSYLPPERAWGEQSGAPGDLWGLGAALYAAVEGHGPFDRNGALASMTAVLADEPKPAAHAGALWPVISGLLRKDPAERLDAAAATRLLGEIAAACAVPAPRRAFRPQPGHPPLQSLTCWPAKGSINSSFLPLSFSPGGPSGLAPQELDIAGGRGVQRRPGTRADCRGPASVDPVERVILKGREDAAD
jgi:hypothetical protein